MILVAAVGEVHANNVKTSIAELVDGLDGVGLGADGADDGSAAELASGLELSVELRKPLNLASEAEMVKRSSGHCKGFVGCGVEGNGRGCRDEDWRSARG